MAVPTTFPGAIVAALRQRHRPSDGTAHSAAALSERVRNRCRCEPCVNSSHRYRALCAGRALQPPTHVSAPFIILAVPLQRLLNSGQVHTAHETRNTVRLDKLLIFAPRISCLTGKNAWTRTHRAHITTTELRNNPHGQNQLGSDKLPFMTVVVIPT